MAIFNTPEQVAAAERAQRMAGGNIRERLAGGIFGLGQEAGDAFRRALGQDTRSAAMVEATALQEAMRGIDTTNRDSILEAANRVLDINPNAAFQLQQFANSMPNIKKDSVSFITTPELPGILIPQIKTTDTFGNEQINLGGPMETMQRILQRTSASLKPNKHTTTGQNLVVDGKVKAVFMDGSGRAYILNPEKITEDNPRGMDYESVTLNEDGLFSSNEERANKSKLVQLGFIRLAKTTIKKIDDESHPWYNFWSGMSEKERTNLALEVAFMADEMWRNEEIKRQYDWNKKALIDTLIGDFMGVTGDPVIFNRGDRQQGGGPAGAATGGIPNDPLGIRTPVGPR